MSHDTPPSIPPHRSAHLRSGPNKFSIRRGLRKLDLTCVAFGAAMLGVVTSIASEQQPTQQPAQDQAAAAPAKGQPQKAPVPAGSQTFNTVITKLKAGKQVFSNTVTEPNLEAAK